jgi:hypothetical protein
MDVVKDVCALCHRWRRDGVYAYYWSYVLDRDFDTEFWCQDCANRMLREGWDLPEHWQLDLEPKRA